jgi:DNA/RNA endonuclease YhcR with UshA esterase domain
MRSKALVFALALASTRLFAQTTIPASEGAKHIGERMTVCGVITGEHTATSSRGTPTFINLDQPYPNQVFTLLIWGDDRGKVGTVPVSGRICATGVITEYRGSPEIVLRDEHSWYAPK